MASVAMKTGGAMQGRQSGVTLIELLVVIMIIAVLSSIAVPGYRAYVIRANRADAKAGLLSAASALERCFTRFNAYNDANCGFALPTPSPDGKYEIQADAVADDGLAAGVTASTFKLRAVPQGTQAEDQQCAHFLLNSRNQKSVSTGRMDCWSR
jgi:type IV pilus assembly protein PilE